MNDHIQLKMKILTDSGVLAPGERMDATFVAMRLNEVVQYAMSCASERNNFQILALIIALALSNHIGGADDVRPT